MSASSPIRRPARPAVVRTAPAAFEPLESRQFLSGTLSPAVDTGLTVTYSKSTLPGSVLAGSNIKGAITLQLTNSTTVDDTGVNTFTVYASGDSVVDAGDRVLRTFSTKLNIKTGRTIKLTIPVQNQAAPLAGDYDVLISATDASGVVATTEITPNPSLIVAPAFVSLSAAIGTVAPTAFSGAKTITFRATITNAGNVNSTGTLTTAIGLSTDGVNVTLPITSQNRRVTIKPNGRAIPLTFHVKVPAGTPAGTYVVAATFTQGTANQVRVFSTTPITIGNA
jgi:hypothetical protein